MDSLYLPEAMFGGIYFRQEGVNPRESGDSRSAICEICRAFGGEIELNRRYGGWRGSGTDA
jgi:hypothetical protein